MAIKKLKEERRYRAYIKEIRAAEFIEIKQIKETEHGISIETTEYVKGIIPVYCGTKLDIFA